MPRQQFRILFIALALAITCGTASFAQSTDPFEQAMMRGDYEKAVSIAEAIAARQPTSSVAAYDAACACSRAGHADRAVTWLLKSADLGFGGVRSIRDDEDLDAVRQHPDFAKAQKRVEANAAVRLAAFKAEAEKAEPTVILPPGHDDSAASPLLIALHGTGGTGKAIAREWRQAAAEVGAIIVAPDALRPVRGTDGYNWVYRDEAEWMVLRTIEESKKKWKISKVVLTGFSQGANIALMVGQSHADRFDAVIPVCGHYERDVATVPEKDPRPRWCLMIGERDPWARTYVEGERAFKAAGMTVRRIVVQDTGHAMPRGRRGQTLLRDVLRWAIEEDTQ